MTENVSNPVDSDALRHFEWHDLPVTEIRLTEQAIELLVTPFSEQTNDYYTRRLKLWGFESVSIDMRGTLTKRDWSDLDIHSFKFEIDQSGRITGELGILPGHAGFWTIAFKNALWKLEPV